MNCRDAIAAIEASFAQGSHTPCPWAGDRAAYIRQKQRGLLACVIEPVPAALTALGFCSGDALAAWWGCAAAPSRAL